MNTHSLDPQALYWASFNRFSLRLSGQAVHDIAQQGSNDEAVEYWHSRIDFDETDLVGRIRSTPDAIRAELKEYGAWDAEELADDEANRRRIVWIAAHNIAEDDSPDCSEALVPSGETGPFRDLGI